MTAPERPESTRPPVGNLTDFVEGCDENNPLDIEISVTEDNKVIVFHDKPFREELSWFEFDAGKSKLEFIFSEGQIREAGMPLAPVINKYMQNAHQILTVLMNDKTGEAEKGLYVPLIVHRS